MIEHLSETFDILKTLFNEFLSPLFCSSSQSRPNLLLERFMLRMQQYLQTNKT